MPKLNGNKYRILAEDTAGSDTYSEIAFITGTDATRTNNAIQVNNKTDGADDTYIPGGNKSYTVSGTGIASDDASYDKLITIQESCPNSWNFRVEQVDDCTDTVVRTVTALMFLTELAESGEINGALTFTITLSSSGAITRA